jgi:hypothetical protein
MRLYKRAVVSMAVALRHLVTFVVDKVVEEDLCLLSTNALGSITLPDGSTRLPGPAARDTFAIFEDIWLLENDEDPRYLRLEYLRMIFAVELIERVLMNYHESPARRVSLSTHVHTGCPHIAVIYQVSQTLALNTTPSPHCSSERSLNTLLSAHAPRHMHHFSRTQAILAQLATETGIFLTLFIKLVSGETRLLGPGYAR